MSSLKRSLIAPWGVVSHLARYPRLWPDKRAAVRLLWAAHRERWEDEAPSPVAFGQVTCLVRPRDWFALDDVWMSGEYEAAVQLLSATPRVLDVGANVGLFAAYVFSRRPGARVLSIEPSPDSFRMLRGNIAMNPALDWRAREAAVWSHEGEVAFAQTPLSSGRRVNVDGADDMRVQAMTVPALLTAAGGAVELLKLDVEGAEGRVAADLSHAAGVARLLIELHPDRCDSDLVISTLRATFPFAYRLRRRQSQKPLLLMARSAVDPTAAGLSALP